MDLSDFLVTLGQDDEARAAYDADPTGYVNGSALSGEHKNELLERPPTTEGINRAIAQRAGADFRDQIAGNVK